MPAPAQVTPTVLVVKRGRGRPRKVPLPPPPLEVPVPAVLVVKRPRGRPRKVPITTSPPTTQPPVKSTAKVKTNKAYLLIAFADLEFYAHNTEREPFISALREAKLINKKGDIPEIRWYQDSITVTPTKSK